MSAGHEAPRRVSGTRGDEQPHPQDALEQQIETVEALVRRKLSEALGGLRGVLEGAVPTLGFTLSWIISSDLRLSLIIGGTAAVIALVLRLVQRSNPQFVINAVVGIGIAAIFALRSGEAEDAFLPGIIYNSAYFVVLSLSALIRWPLIGFVIGSVTGDPTGWHANKQIVKLCSLLTWILAAPCLVRVVVQYPLWAAGEVAWLGAAKIAMGWPLQVAAFAAMAYVLARNRIPLEAEPTR